jgi:hypothetical protein
MSTHPDDQFHPPKDDDPFWTETSWWTFAVPERKLSGQLYPFFRPNQKVAACAVYLWNDEGHQWNTALYARQTWHLPLVDQTLSDLKLANGLQYRCLEPRTKYELEYHDPDGDDVSVDLTFTAVLEPNHDGHGHLDQPGRIEGTVVLDGERIPVDCYGFRDRSWGRRGGFGRNMVTKGGHYAGYSFATASPADGFHALSFDRGSGEVEVVHGYLVQDGTFAKLQRGLREVLERDRATGYQTRVRIEAVDELGRALETEGTCVNKFGFLLNPNIWSVNCLTEWTFNGRTAWGEDHDNWTPVGYRRFYRDFLGYAPALTA